MSILTEVIGKGPTFPIELTNNSSGESTWAVLEGDLELLSSDVIGLMAYSLGERVRQEDLGHRLNELIEEPNTLVSQHLVKKFCVEYLNRAEFRIKPLAEKDISTIITPTTISITIKVTLLGIGSTEEISLNINR